MTEHHLKTSAGTLHVGDRVAYADPVTKRPYNTAIAAIRAPHVALHVQEIDNIVVVPGQSLTRLVGVKKFFGPELTRRANIALQEHAAGPER